MNEESQGNMPTSSWEQAQLWGTWMHCGNTRLAQKLLQGTGVSSSMAGRIYHSPHISSSSLLFSCNSYTKAGCGRSQNVLLVQAAEAGGQSRGQAAGKGT